MPILRKNSPNLDSRHWTTWTTLFLRPSPVPPGECQVLRSPLWSRPVLGVAVPSRESVVLSLRPSRPGGVSSTTLLGGGSCQPGLYTVFSAFVPVAQCLVTYELGFRLAGAATESKYLFKDLRPPCSLRARFVGLTDASAAFLAGKCSTWAVLSPPLQVPTAAGGLQFPACSGKGRETQLGSSTWPLTMASLCRYRLSGSSVWFVSSLQQGAPSRIRHAKNQISYDPAGKSQRLKQRSPSFLLG